MSSSFSFSKRDTLKLICKIHSMADLLPAWWIKEVNKSSTPPQNSYKAEQNCKNNPFSALESYQGHDEVTGYLDFLGTVPILDLKFLHLKKLFPRVKKFNFQHSCLGKRYQTIIWLPNQGILINAMLFLVSSGYGFSYLSIVTVTVFNLDHWYWQTLFVVHNNESSIVGSLEGCNLSARQS